MLGHSKLEFTLKYYTHITGHMADMARMAIDEKLLQFDNKFKIVSQTLDFLSRTCYNTNTMN